MPWHSLHDLHPQSRTLDERPARRHERAMPIHSKTLLTLLVPLLLLGGIFWLQQTGRETVPPSVQEPAWQSEDFAQAALGALPSAWATPRGTIQVQEKAGRKLVAFLPEPMVEGRVLVPGVLPGGGTVRARFSGESGKRAHPRFGVGLANEASFLLRYLPGEKLLELITPTTVEINAKIIPEDRRLDSCPLDIPANSWLWLELRMTADGTCEGRCWPDGAARPPAPQLLYAAARPAGLLHASLHAAPYALKPVYLDRVEWQ